MTNLHAMKQTLQLSSRILVIAAAVLIFAPNSARALSLADLVAGGSITSADGTLMFDDFKVELPAIVGGKTNALSGLDLGIFQVETLERSFGLQAFEMDGPISALMGQAGRMLIEFRVVALGGALIRDVGLSFVGAASGSGANVGVTQTLRGTSAGAELFVGRADGGLQQPVDSVSLRAAQGELLVNQDILVDSGNGFLAQVSEIEQTYGVASAAVPEPTAGALYLFGLLTIGAGTRARSRRD